jgi:hypothetical protein
MEVDFPHQASVVDGFGLTALLFCIVIMGMAIPPLLGMGSFETF